MSRTGEILAQDYRSTMAPQGKEAVIKRMTDAAHDVLQKAGVELDQVGAVGVGAPGPMDAKAGILTAPPNLPGWRNVPLSELIQARLGLPTYLENDANAAALAEFYFGAGQGCKNMIYVTASTGIGGGLILNRQLYFGSNGSAGEVGHMTILPHGPLCGCGNRGHLEALASGTAIAREARERMDLGVPTLIADLVEGDPSAVTAHVVAQAAEQGDEEAERIIAEAMRFLGLGMANLANIFNPDFIVIGGGLTNLGDRMFEPVRRIVKETAFPVIAQNLQVVPAKLGSAVGVIGAATVAISRSGSSG